jgi:hypothetical protein
MTVADAIEDHRSRCLPHLVRLRMLGSGDAGVALSPGVAAEVIQATRAVLAQVEAASRLALASSPGGQHDHGPGQFLATRLTRLSAAADDAVAAARSGDMAALRRRLLRFDALTSAIWTAQGAARGWSVPRARAGESTAR